MPTIRDLISALRRRDGVDAAVALGRDGVLIDGNSAASLDPDGLAAFVPPMALTGSDLGVAAQCGEGGLMALESGTGYAVVPAPPRDAFLRVRLQPSATLASLLFELRRNCAQTAALV